jgi:vacuolar-type H+-ATPase subunit C/Vma6
VDTPLAPYFSECITSEDLDDMNIEIMRNTLYKAYLEDFYKFCQVFAVHMVFAIGSDFVGVFVLLWY